MVLCLVMRLCKVVELGKTGLLSMTAIRGAVTDACISSSRQEGGVATYQQV